MTLCLLSSSLSSTGQTGPGEMRNLRGVQTSVFPSTHLFPCALSGGLQRVSTDVETDMQNKPLIRESVSQSTASPKQSISHDYSLSSEQKNWVTSPYLRQMCSSASTSCAFLGMSEQILEWRYVQGGKTHREQLLTNRHDKREYLLERCLKYIPYSVLKVVTLYFLQRMASFNCLQSHVTFVFR